MDRYVNKYVLDNTCINQFLAYTQASFDVLEINGMRQFAYASYYFDSAELHTFKAHNQGRRRRIKIRHRCYMDTNTHFLEIKLKGFRGVTHKARIEVVPERVLLHGALAPELQAFCQRVLREHGYPEWRHALLPSIAVYYERITLSAKNKNERITIDQHIAFASPDQATPLHLNDQRWVVEIKSLTGRTAADHWLLKNRQRQVGKCSKYGMGITLLNGINSVFKPTIKQAFGAAR